MRISDWSSDVCSSDLGYKLEVPPLQPMLASSVMGAFGKALTDDMAQLPNMQVLIALLRDGFHDDSAGGRVLIDDSGQPIFDYDIHDRLWAGLRRASLTKIGRASGRERVGPEG